MDSSQVGATALDLLQNSAAQIHLPLLVGTTGSVDLGLLFQQVKLIHPVLPLILSALAFSPASCPHEHLACTFQVGL